MDPLTRSLALALGVAAALSAPAGAEGEGALLPPSPLPLSWCVERARSANPTLAVQQAAADAARERIVPAGALEDPRFSYQASNVPVHELDFDSTPMSGHQLGLNQRIPFPGLLGSREDAARAGSRAAEAMVTDRELRVAAAVEQAFAELAFAQRAVDITARNEELLRQLARIAESKYSVGSGLQQDVVRAQLELTRTLNEQLGRRAAEARSEAALAALLDLPPEVPLPRTAELEAGAPLPGLPAVLSRLEETSPHLRALRQREEEAERMRRAAELEGYPDFDLGIGYRIRETTMGDPVDGDDFLQAGVTIRLPLHRARWRARVAESEALWRRARSEYRQGLAALRQAVRTRFADLERADAEVALLESGLVPQARQSLSSSRSAYEVDAVDFLSLVDAQVRLFESELRLERARADRHIAFAGLEAESGQVLR